MCVFFLVFHSKIAAKELASLACEHAQEAMVSLYKSLIPCNFVSMANTPRVPVVYENFPLDDILSCGICS